MFILNPDSFLMPSYRISPFTTKNLAHNHRLPENTYAVEYFNNRFGEGNWQYTFNGREAIRMALEAYHLKKEDLVTIVTTSQNFYISSCVTREIETFCRWNREILPETKIIFVNHEFGYPYSEMKQLSALGLPIIEDCCTTFFSQDTIGNIGKYGDFSVYSFPKFFPIQIGGLIVSNNKTLEKSKETTVGQLNHIQNVVSHKLQNTKELLRKRKEIYNYAVHIFSELGFSERFEKSEIIVPSVLLLNNNGIVKDLNLLKKFLAQNGIMSSVFYGEDAFFIPNHQSLKKEDVDYFFFCVQEFIISNTSAL